MTRIFHWFFMYNIDPMSGFDITAQRQYIAVQKMSTLLQQGYNARKVISEVWESLVLQCTVRKKRLSPRKSLRKTNIKCSHFLQKFSSLDTLQMTWLIDCVYCETYMLFTWLIESVYREKYMFFTWLIDFVCYEIYLAWIYQEL